MTPTTDGRLVAPDRSRPLLALSLLYAALTSAFMIWRGISVSPDYLLLLLLPVAIASGRFWRFLGDWIPFIVIFLAWEAMRGIAPRTGIPPHVQDLARHRKETVRRVHAERGPAYLALRAAEPLISPSPAQVPIVPEVE